jgi:hypothetical protein
MKESKNDITGDKLKTKVTSDSYRKGWDLIFSEKESERHSLAECLSYPCEQCGQPWNECGCDPNED